MAAYLQQGHGSWGLLEEADIGSYDGLVLSRSTMAPMPCSMVLPGSATRETTWR